MGLLPPRPPGSAQEAGAGMASQLGGWLGVTHPHTKGKQQRLSGEGGGGPAHPGLVLPNLFVFILVPLRNMETNVLDPAALSLLFTGLVAQGVVAWLRPAPSWRGSLFPAPIPVLQGKVRGWGAGLRSG